tara:strand:- start:914 stop:1096 length:183 start_codon:yes stop_codon:yes gene_type:complete
LINPSTNSPSPFLSIQPDWAEQELVEFDATQNPEGVSDMLAKLSEMRGDRAVKQVSAEDY